MKSDVDHIMYSSINCPVVLCTRKGSFTVPVSFRCSLTKPLEFCKGEVKKSAQVQSAQQPVPAIQLLGNYDLNTVVSVLV